MDHHILDRILVDLLDLLAPIHTYRIYTVKLLLALVSHILNRTFLYLLLHMNMSNHHLLVLVNRILDRTFLWLLHHMSISNLLVLLQKPVPAEPELPAAVLPSDINSEHLFRQPAVPYPFP